MLKFCGHRNADIDPFLYCSVGKGQIHPQEPFIFAAFVAEPGIRPESETSGGLLIQHKFLHD